MENEIFYFTGVGSRETPCEIKTRMSLIAKIFTLAGWTLRSGAAMGADSAFERGCDIFKGPKEIYLPWKNFMNHPSSLCRPSEEAITLVEQFHPAPGALTRAAKLLHARNCHQVLGGDLKTPSRVLVCWTKDGCTDRASRTRQTGGTGTAIVCAADNGIPVYNLFNEVTAERLFKDMNLLFSLTSEEE